MLPQISLYAFIALQLGGVALFVSLAVTGFTRLGGLGDVPDGRSAHARTTPTAGGLGIIAGFGAAILIAAIFHAETFFQNVALRSAFASLLACAFALGIMGVIDDRIVIPTRLKFALIIAISLYASWAIGAVTGLPVGLGLIVLPVWLGLVGTVLWLFVVTNSVNFMDGINGLFGGTMALATLSLCLIALSVDAPVTALLSGTLSAALIGFLPYNLRRRAAIFCGDCGSLPVGFLYAGSILLLVREQPNLPLLYVGPLLIMPLLADVLLTLAMKPRRGLSFTAPHATHIYQRASRAFGGPLPVTMIYIALVGMMAILVNQALLRGTIGSMMGLAIVAVTFTAAYMFAHRILPK